MPRTRPPKPTELLKLSGTLRKDRHASRFDADLDTLPPESSFPLAPNNLHPRAASLWEPWIKGLLLKRVLTLADFSTLEIGFRLLSQALYYSDRIAAEGMPDFLDDDALERRKALDKLFQEATKAYLKVMYEYGSTPAARAALKVPPEPEKDLDPLEVVIGN
jgi:phage terminase small subunit